MSPRVIWPPSWLRSEPSPSPQPADEPEPATEKPANLRDYDRLRYDGLHTADGARYHLWLDPDDEMAAIL